MVKDSKIGWTDDTFSGVRGCTKVSPACTYCYAEEFENRFNQVVWGANGTRIMTGAANWKNPIKWDRQQAEENAKNGTKKRRKVFTASLSDVFEDWGGDVLDRKQAAKYTMQQVRERLFLELIDKTPNLVWLILTKRPENILRFWVPKADGRTYRDNVWLGTTVENQEYVEKRVPLLAKARRLTDVLFLSCEPLLGSISLWPDAMEDCPNAEGLIMDPTTGAYECCSRCDYTGIGDKPIIDWVIAGCESGKSRRPSELQWFRSLRDECKEYEIPFFMKQMAIGKKVETNVKAFPKDLQVQESPSPDFAEAI